MKTIQMGEFRLMRINDLNESVAKYGMVAHVISCDCAGCQAYRQKDSE